MNTNEELHDAIQWIVGGLERGEISLPIDAGNYSPLDWALIYEATPTRLRAQAWQLLPRPQLGAILAAMRDEVRRLALNALSEQELVDIATTSSSAEIIDFIELLPRTEPRHSQAPVGAGAGPGHLGAGLWRCRAGTTGFPRCPGRGRQCHHGRCNPGPAQSGSDLSPR